jgi:hypothetical protein
MKMQYYLKMYRGDRRMDWGGKERRIGYLGTCRVYIRCDGDNDINTSLAGLIAQLGERGTEVAMPRSLVRTRLEPLHHYLLLTVAFDPFFDQSRTHTIVFSLGMIRVALGSKFESYALSCCRIDPLVLLSKLCLVNPDRHEGLQV